jgi:hypothetical protein
LENNEDTKSVAVWNAVLGAALAVPGIRISRANYLRSVLAKHVARQTVEQAIATTPARAGVPIHVVERAARTSVLWHRAGVTATSTVLGLPGGWWVGGAIPADVAQYFAHVIMVLQKLAFLNGWPDFVPPPEEELDDDTRLVLTLFIGVMFGAQEANIAINKLAQALAQEVVTRIPRGALTKYAIYNVAKQVAKWLGVQLTKKKFAEFVGRTIPIVGGLLGGTVTWLAFGIGAKRLRLHLEGLPLAGG